MLDVVEIRIAEKGLSFQSTELEDCEDTVECSSELEIVDIDVAASYYASRYTSYRCRNVPGGPGLGFIKRASQETDSEIEENLSIPDQKKIRAWRIGAQPPKNKGTSSPFLEGH